MPTYLVYDEAAKRTRLSVSLLQKLVNRGEIPHLKVGRRTLFDADDLDAWMLSHRKGAAS